MTKRISRTKSHVLIEDDKGDERLCSMEILGQASYMGEEWLDHCELVNKKEEYTGNKD